MQHPLRSALVSLALTGLLAACASCGGSSPSGESPGASSGGASGGSGSGAGGAGAGSGGTGSTSAGAGSGTPAPATCAGLPDAPKGAQKGVSLTVGSAKRTYAITVPEAASADKALPLVLVFHGDGGNGDRLRASFGLDAVVAGEAITVYPDGPNGGWDISTPDKGNKDLDFVDALIDAVAASYCVDRGRVFATGFSKGAYFTNHLGFRRAERLKGIVPHAGGGPSEGEYDENGKLVVDGVLPVMMMHGTSDGSVPISESAFSREYWTRANACAKTSKPEGPPGCVAFDGCKNPVRYCTLQGVPHRVPPESVKATWEFFKGL